jgi:hypothetical protein
LVSERSFSSTSKINYDGHKDELEEGDSRLGSFLKECGETIGEGI